MATWLEDLLDSTKELEAPQKFFLWAGLATISAIVKNNVWFDRYGATDLVRVYPNLYVMTIAPSGHGKGVPVALSKMLIDEVGGVRTISGRNSIESILQQLGNARTVPGRKGPQMDSTAYIISGELSTALVRNPDSLTILTDLYDGQYNATWSNTMKHTGIDKLEKPNVTLLGGLNDTHFNDMISAKEITGGFIARCQLVVSRERTKSNDLLDPPERPIDIKGLSVHLKKLKNLAGPFVLDPEAKALYRAWYATYKPESSHDKTGSAMRVRDHIWKVAQAISLSREPELILRKSDVETAMRLCLESTSRAETVTEGAGQSEMSVKQRVFLHALLGAPGYRISRTTVLRRCHGDFDAFDLKRLEETFFQGGIIKEPYSGRLEGMKDKDVIYELTPRTIEDYLK